MFRWEVGNKSLSPGGHSLSSLPLPGNKEITAGGCFLRNNAGKPEGEAGPERKVESPTRCYSMCLLQGGGPMEKGLPKTQNKQLNKKDRKHLQEIVERNYESGGPEGP